MNGYTYTALVPTDTSHYVVLSRESNDSIFFWNPTNQVDMLWYDFNLQVGDSIGLPGGTFVADTVSTILDLNLHPRRYIHLTDSTNWVNIKYRWVYGVGNIDYGLTGYENGNFAYQFICVSDSSGTIWLSDQPSVAALCDSLATIPENSIEKNVVTIFPNPSDKIATLKWNSNLKFNRLILRSCTGAIVTQQNVSGSDFVLDVSALGEGLYFYSLFNNDGECENGKLIVSH